MVQCYHLFWIVTYVNVLGCQMLYHAVFSLGLRVQQCYLAPGRSADSRELIDNQLVAYAQVL